MKIKNIIIILSLALLYTACDNDSVSMLPSGSININDKEAVIAVSDNGTNELSFSASENWTISISDTAKTAWLTVSPIEGQAGDKTITLTAVPNMINDRKAYITIKSGSSEVTLAVEQLFGNGITDIPIPDKAFREYCLTNFDKDGDGLISYNEVKDVESVIIRYYSSIKLIEGIEYFTNLKSLSVNSTDLRELDMSRNKKLTTLSCSYNYRLTDINITGNTELVNLSCVNNSKLENIDLTQNSKLKTLDCSYADISNLDLSGCPELASLICYSTNITSLDLSANNKLTELGCYNSNIQNLDITNCTSLITLDCSNSFLTSLDISGNTELIYLRCSSNGLTSLDTSRNTKLKELNCSYNSITALDLSQNIALVYLTCNRNNLSFLDASASKSISQIYCYSNPNLAEVWVNKDAYYPYVSRDYHTVVYYK